jgi:hypothetical protein
MGRNNADFQNYILVHRGVNGVTASQLLSSPRHLGKHWSSSESVADQFARKGGKPKGTVVTGLVHPDDLMTPEEIEEHNQKNSGQMLRIYPGGEYEKEVPVRPGSTVHIVGSKDWDFRGDEIEVKKQKTFKTPRQAKA